jgi:hypothetical protein
VHCWVTIDDLAQIVFARAHDDLLNFGDQSVETLPTQCALYCHDLILPANLGGQHRFRHADQSPR